MRMGKEERKESRSRTGCGSLDGSSVVGNFGGCNRDVNSAESGLSADFY